MVFCHLAVTSDQDYSPWEQEVVLIVWVMQWEQVLQMSVLPRGWIFHLLILRQASLGDALQQECSSTAPVLPSPIK